jgi:hypothetical protein
MFYSRLGRGCLELNEDEKIIGPHLAMFSHLMLSIAFLGIPLCTMFLHEMRFPN